MHMYIKEAFERRVNILITHAINDVLHEVKARKISVNALFELKKKTG